jgi:hypothetical protein
MHNTTINKYLYKIFLIFTKYLPITLAVLFVINLICNHYKLSFSFLAYFGGVSFSFLGLLYLMSWVFQFCHLYRIPLYYITIGNIIGVVNKEFPNVIPSVITDRVYFIITGIMLIIYIWFMHKKRSNPKVDYIKQLCENYCGCKKENPA